MRIGIYALAKNEEANVPRWEASCREADIRVVTDTGSTDTTPALLEDAGVTVARGAPIPWRWDDAHQLSLNHLPADVDVAIRLDLDEELAPGWRDAIHAAWTTDTTKLRYRYQWSRALHFLSDRVHARAGYRWTGATHEGLVRWAGDEVQTFAPGLEVRHHREPGKRHSSDLTLLRRAVHENPNDARMAWYLARELDYLGDPTAAKAFRDYLAMPGGAATERGYALRVLARLEPESAKRRLAETILATPHEPEAYLTLATMAAELGDQVATLFYARHAAACPPDSMTHASDPAAYGAKAHDLAAVAAHHLGLHVEAKDHAARAAALLPTDRRLEKNHEILHALATEPGPRAA